MDRHLRFLYFLGQKKRKKEYEHKNIDFDFVRDCCHDLS